MSCVQRRNQFSFTQSIGNVFNDALAEFSNLEKEVESSMQCYEEARLAMRLSTAITDIEEHHQEGLVHLHRTRDKVRTYQAFVRGLSVEAIFTMLRYAEWSEQMKLPKAMTDEKLKRGIEKQIHILEKKAKRVKLECRIPKRKEELLAETRMKKRLLRVKSLVGTPEERKLAGIKQHEAFIACMRAQWQETPDMTLGKLELSSKK